MIIQSDQEAEAVQEMDRSFMRGIRALFYGGHKVIPINRHHEALRRNQIAVETFTAQSRERSRVTWNRVLARQKPL